MWLLDGVGYVTRSDNDANLDITQPEGAIRCLWYLMTFIPAGVALLSMLIVWLYPLTTERVDAIVKELNAIRGGRPAPDSPEQDEMTDYANQM